MITKLNHNFVASSWTHFNNPSHVVKFIPTRSTVGGNQYKEDLQLVVQCKVSHQQKDPQLEMHCQVSHQRDDPQLEMHCMVSHQREDHEE